MENISRYLSLIKLNPDWASIIIFLSLSIKYYQKCLIVSALSPVQHLGVNIGVRQDVATKENQKERETYFTTKFQIYCLSCSELDTEHEWFNK